MSDYAFKIGVFAYQLQRGRGTDAFYRVEIVAAKENAEIDELYYGQ